MNKWQIIAPILAIGGAILFFAPVYVRRARMQSRDQQLWFAYRAGDELIEKTNTSFIKITPELKQRLSEFLASPADTEAARIGDEPPPIGDGKATMRLFLRNEKGERLGIRILRDTKLGDYRVLSFWTLNPYAPSP